MGCANCGTNHFKEGRIRRAFSAHQALRESNDLKVDITRINNLLPPGMSPLLRNAIGQKVFFLDCRYFSVFEGTCPLPGPSFKMGIANFLPNVGIIDPTTREREFFECHVDLTSRERIVGTPSWTRASAHFVDLDLFIQSYAALAPNEFKPGCVQAAMSIW